MIQEEKDLLLRDLYARLPYGVKFKADNEECIREIHYIKDEDVYIREYRNLSYWIDTIKPYLRPMSSMTEEEKDELASKHIKLVFQDSNHNPETVAVDIDGFDWLNAHHFDYRGLIEKGLALEASNDMYKLNKK